MAYQWSEARQHYLYDSGKVVPQAVVNRALERVLINGANQMRALTEQLQAGTITLSTWQTSMAAEMKLLHTGAAALGRGGWQQMSQSDWGWTGAQLRRHYGFLRAFAQDIATGKQAYDGRMIARAAMYAEAARSTQREMQRRMGQKLGRTEERNQLGAADRHCSSCLGCTARGWVPIGSLPAVGSRSCLSHCHCSIQTRVTPAPVARAA